MEVVTATWVAGIVAFMLGFIIGRVYTVASACKHKWELIKEGNIVQRNDIWSGKKLDEPYTIGYSKLYECEKCKKSKTVKR